MLVLLLLNKKRFLFAGFYGNLVLITLGAAAKAVSRNPTGSIRARCSCRTACTTNCCGCYKADRKCSHNCDLRSTGGVNCCNLSGGGDDTNSNVTGNDNAGSDRDGAGSDSMVRIV